MTTEPYYGSQTVCRPLLSNVPKRPPGAVKTECPYCGDACWSLSTEPIPLPPDVAAACTHCALKRGTHQREMDEMRARKEGKL